MKHRKPTYIAIRHIPIRTLLSWNSKRLEITQQNIEQEIHRLEKELRQAKLALRWMQGVIRIQAQGGKNGK